MILLARLGVVALVIGAATAVAATERVTLSLVLIGALKWTFVPFLQTLTGLFLLRGLSGSRLRQLERYFETHWPWSIWILLFCGAMLLLPASLSGVSLAMTAVVPLLWTIWLLLEFCQADLSLDRRSARRRVAQHQSITCLLVLVYVSLAVALWPRVVGALT